ncbi:hypothetical protein MMC07_009223 [Pseudocyphellaria aurata]|nr:hypothetical protein [Pseudocyphellaria aurata]
MSNPYEKLCQDQELRLQQQGEQLSNLRKDYQELINSSDRKDAEFRALTELHAHTKKELEQLQITSSIQNRDLVTCRDNLFQLQPVIQLSDSEILKQYDTLCQQVSNWVDNGISKFEDISESYGNDKIIIRDGGITWIKLLLKNLPLADEYIISALIHTRIQHDLFGADVILFGLSRSDAQLLHEVEEQMAKLEPKRDSTAINAWRSETLKAIAARSETTQSKDSMVKDFTENLFHDLQRIFPGLRDVPESKLRLSQDVSRHAAQLEASIHQSSTTYRFWSRYRKLGDSYPPVRDSDMTGITWIDVDTRKTLTSNSLVIPDSNGFIGTPQLLIERGLDRYDAGTERSTTLRQATYLIQLHRPLGRRTR